MKRGHFIIIVLLMLFSTLLACQVVTLATTRPAHPCDCDTCVEFHRQLSAG